jgi:protein NirF
MCGCTTARREATGEAPGGALGTRVLVVERDSGALAVYDYAERRLLPERIEGLGDLTHATMTFSPDLRHGFLATRSGRLVRIDLATARASGEVQTSKNSIDNAVSHDGRTIAVAEYVPGGITLVDAATLAVKRRHEATFQRGGEAMSSRVTGMVDAPGNKFVCVLIEGQEIWILDASRGDFPIERRIPAGEGMPYDAMITADGRFYVVGKLGTARIAVLDLAHPTAVREVSLADPEAPAAQEPPKKLPHMASWAVAGRHVFVPLVGEKRMAVLDRETFAFQRSIPLRGHPVYAVRSPTEREVWVSFSGATDDAYLQIIDTERLAVTGELLVGKRIYHLDFTPRGSHVLVTANQDNALFLIDALSRQIVDRQPLRSPSGVFGPWRAFRIGL